MGLSTVGICQSTQNDSEAPELTPDVEKRLSVERKVWVTEYHFTPDEKRLLEPSDFDQRQAANFLQQSDTGLIRLYPWERPRLTVSVADLVDGRSPEFNLHACIFSFSKQKHGNALNGYVDPRLGWAELKLREGRFYTGFTGESLGVLVALGDVPLETVTPKTDGVIGLANIISPADYLEASALSRRNRAGFQMDRFRYGSSLPVAAATTYAMRSTGNRRSDLLVAFRVQSISNDGSVTILWHKLKQYPKPAWKRREE